MKPEFKKIFDSVQYKTKDSKDHSDACVNIAGVDFVNNTELGHFIVQHFRIPRMLNFKITYVKLMQIAYSSGQLKAEFDNPKINIDPKVKSFYESNKLNSIETYLEKND